MDKRYYDFVVVTPAQRAAYDTAYQSAMRVSRCKAVAQCAGERAIWIEVHQSRHERRKTEKA